MRAVVQRVSRARVSVGKDIIGEIGPGLLVLLGISKHDAEDDAAYIVQKLLALRIFDDAEGKMNLSVSDAGGSILIVSQFTLYGDVRKGRRPSYDLAAAPATAERWYEHVIAEVRSRNIQCETGRFRAMMDVESVNDGPVTILLDSSKTF